jgi:CheY-like chemotaxis protein
MASPDQTQADQSIRLHFAVTDTGPGIAPDEIDLLFQAFAQTQSGRQSEEGTGLGLAISYQFVTLMGGTFTVESTVGEGSTFAFEIPSLASECALVCEVPNAHNPVQLMLSPHQSPPKILVVDDNSANRDVLATLLQHWGCTVQTAVDGEDAIAQWQTWQPDLIFMDIRMPKLDGKSAIAQIRAQQESKQPKIVALTAIAFAEERDQIFAAGCDEFICKPFKQPEIVDCLQQQLGLQFERRDLSPTPPSNAILPKPEKRIQQPRILLVEDNLINQKVALMHLQNLGYTADVVNNGQEAIDALQTQVYDIILMDIQMPKMDGITATKIIRRDYPETEQPYIIAMTASDDERDREHCLAAGMNSYLTKPIRRDRLQQKLQEGQSLTMYSIDTKSPKSH